ncbi:MAG TPA: DUF1499 domain-containing protein [Aliidongia sp.]|uniref:DUF1499 domain-containing protein n=1 Tax=Aliidongia sp. TaxID=1914230 RepID=UPI002DDD3E84|nr:DUF1499 domain-containing protein [Aliidongia sp.]HEV2673396.1 DUF1499 domain-containing protein [Aliidongia sp.]
MVLGLVLVGLVAIRIVMGRDAEDRVAEGEVAEFGHLSAKPKHSRFLMCPKDYCSRTPDAESPVFDMEWERLRDLWSETVARQHRVKLVAGDGDRRKITYVQHSVLLRLPAIVTIEFVDLPDGKSSFAIESRSRYGRLDFGANAARVRNWVGLLQSVAKR